MDKLDLHKLQRFNKFLQFSSVKEKLKTLTKFKRRSNKLSK